ADGIHTGIVATVPTCALATSTPVAANQSLSTAENTDLPVTLTATDSDGDALTYSISTAPAHGSLSRTSNGSYTYTPDLNYHGAESFSLTCTDGSNTSNIAAIT